MDFREPNGAMLMYGRLSANLTGVQNRRQRLESLLAHGKDDQVKSTRLSNLRVEERRLQRQLQTAAPEVYRAVSSLR